MGSALGYVSARHKAGASSQSGQAKKLDTIYTPEHGLQHGRAELTDGRLVPVFERPARLECILGEFERRGFPAPLPPQDRGLEPILAVHESAYVAFLQCAWDEWVAVHGTDGDALPLCWRAPGMREDREPQSIDGRLGHWSFDAGTPITAGTWAAVRAAAQVADSARLRVSAGAPAAFALARPPGHHAGSRFYGGYCFLNGAAIAAQGFCEAGIPRVAVLDVDYHHGNGTQQIFAGRTDVFTVSVHADPSYSYPFFLGHADETEGGTHLNVPLPRGTDWPRYEAALGGALDRIAAHSAGALVISLGVDTWKGDPLCSFALETPDYRRMGHQIGRLGLPSVIVMEGGYALESLGRNVAEFLEGFDEA
jgi:acetoin utilization deacetylase AcuC-like enzyme